MSIDIREFSVADYAAARSLWDRSEGMGLSDADSPEGVERFLARNPGTSFVAEDDGLVVATILGGHDGRRGFIYHLAVSETHRRRGLGRRLVGLCLDALRARGVQKCHLLTLRENEEGLAFWRKIAAEERKTVVMFSFLTDRGA